MCNLKLIIMQIPPFSDNIMSDASLFSQAISLVGPNCSAIPVTSQCQESLLSQARERAREAAEWGAKAGISSGIY
jgi:hypothetical protein